MYLKLGLESGSAEMDSNTRKLGEIGREATRLGQTGLPRLKVLQGPSFAVYMPSFVLDHLLSDALRVRNVQVIPIYCDGIQSLECNFFGGVWRKGQGFSENCERCQADSRRLWRDSPFHAIALSTHLSGDAIRTVEEVCLRLGQGEWHQYREGEMPLGSWARDILVNNWVVGDHTLIPGHEVLGRAHLRNLLLVKAAYERILDEVRPDRVLSNDSYYGMWAIMQHLCRERGIPYYSHWPITSTRAAFAKDDAAMNLDTRAAWGQFSRQPWSASEREEVDAWLSRASGKRGLMIETSTVQPHQDVTLELGGLDSTKPTALLPANVIWDLAALNKQVVFANMMEWIAETIEWFAQHPQYQLIVKPHPAEQSPGIPETQERVEVALACRGMTIPPNVILLSPKVNASVYDILPLATVGIVHTTSVGFEMAAFGLPVITTARSPYRGFGFTFDPSNRGEYWHVLAGLLRGSLEFDRAARADLARRYVLLQQFHYYTRLGLFEHEWLKPPRLLVNSAADLLPGRNPHLDYVMDAIVDGHSVFGPDRWPPRS